MMPRNYTKKGYRKKRSLNMDGPAADMQVVKDAGLNFKYHEFAKEFVNNGCDTNEAYITIFGGEKEKTWGAAKKLVNKPFMVDLIRAYFVGDHDELPTKDWAINEWRKQVESNVLNYIDDDGDFLNVPELRKLPRYAQRAIKSIEVNTRQMPVKVKGKIVYGDDDKPIMITTQRVSIKLIDKQKALNDMARAQKWIDNHMQIKIQAPITADQLIEAQMRRQKMLSAPEVIDVTPEIEDEQSEIS